MTWEPIQEVVHCCFELSGGLDDVKLFIDIHSAGIFILGTWSFTGALTDVRTICL